MSARVIVHPRCVAGPGAGALAAHLQGQGYDINRIVVGPMNKHGRCELVRIIDETPDSLILERLDGSRYLHKAGQQAPEAA